MLRRLIHLIVLGVILLGGGGVGATEKLYEGYCVNGDPVITRWDPSLSPKYRAVCAGNVLGLESDMGDAPELALQPEPEPPEDWSTWADIKLNGKWMTNPYRDVLPYVTTSTGRTMIPIRMVTEGMGGKAEWNDAEQQVTIRLGERYMVMTVGAPHGEANGTPVTLDQPPLIWMNRTMVPLRVVVEAFGAQVDWKASLDLVEITMTGVTCAPGYCLEWLD